LVLRRVGYQQRNELAPIDLAVRRQRQGVDPMDLGRYA
jgi:hypothetical protein